MCDWDLGVWIKGRKGGKWFFEALALYAFIIGLGHHIYGAGWIMQHPKTSWSIERGSTPTRSMLPLQRENRFSTKKVESNRGINRQKEMRTSLSFLFSNLYKTPHYYPTGIFCSIHNLMSWYNFQRMEVASPFHRLQKCRKLVPEMASVMFIL